MSKICPNCKREIDENVKFCPFCAAFTGETPQEKKKSEGGTCRVRGKGAYRCWTWQDTESAEHTSRSGGAYSKGQDDS